MNRKYNLDYYKEKIKKIREIRKDIAITTDLIVGYPEETEEDFNDTLETAHTIAFSKIHVFPYSLRSNTKAADIKDQVDGNTKKERARRLLNLSKELEIDYFNKFIGKNKLVLIENKKDGYSYGHTDNYLYVKIKGEFENNTFVNVKLKEINYPYISGEKIDE